MAYPLPENWGCSNADQLLEGVEEISEISTALLMSLLDESQWDQEADNDRLITIMQSLEEEIHPELSIIPQSCLDAVDTESGWTHTEVMPTYNRIANYYMDLCGDDEGMDGIIQCSQPNWDTVSLEENEWTSLW